MTWGYGPCGFTCVSQCPPHQAVIQPPPFCITQPGPILSCSNDSLAVSCNAPCGYGCGDGWGGYGGWGGWGGYGGGFGGYGGCGGYGGWGGWGGCGGYGYGNRGFGGWCGRGWGRWGC